MVLVEGHADMSDESAMVLGCSEIIVLVPNANHPATVAEQPRVQNVTASLLSATSLFAAVRLSSPAADKCAVTLTVYGTAKAVARHRLNCTAPWTTVTELPAERSYQVCATADDSETDGGGGDDDYYRRTAVCATVDGYGPAAAAAASAADWYLALGTKSYAFLLSATLTAVVFLFALLAYRTACKACKKPAGGVATAVQTHQCFLPVPPVDGGGAQRPRYVKLQATTVL